jgi:hypothetical protein
MGKVFLLVLVLAAALGVLTLVYEIVVSNVNIDWQSP